MANQEHLEILKQGVNIWNQWRKEHFDVKPDLSCADLSEADLTDVNLKDADLSGANLSKALFSHREGLDPKTIDPNLDLRFELTVGVTDPSKSNLYRVDLHGANLHGANLFGAIIGEANLHGAILSEANLSWADLREVDLSGADLSGANLLKATFILTNLSHTNFRSAELRFADFGGANLNHSNLSHAKLRRASFRNLNIRDTLTPKQDIFYQINLSRADLSWADLREVDLSGVDLREAVLSGADLREVNLSGHDLRGKALSKVNLSNADLSGKDLSGANLSEANLSEVNLSRTNLSGTNLNAANLTRAIAVETNLESSILTNCSIYGISVWDVRLQGAKQDNLVITPEGQPTITVDNLKIAQFIYLLLNNTEIREAIDTITSKAVLILGCFTAERKTVLDALREGLRKRDYLPILFDFEQPSNRNFTETVRTLALLSRFILADLTDPSSIPHELMAIVPTLKVPVQPLLLEGKREYSMFIDFRDYPWVLPTHLYENETSLIQSLAQVIAPAEQASITYEKERQSQRLNKPPKNAHPLTLHPYKPVSYHLYSKQSNGYIKGSILYHSEQKAQELA